jgi:hypothetical protein
LRKRRLGSGVVAVPDSIGDEVEKLPVFFAGSVSNSDENM